MVSILMPTYNDATNIEAAIKSVLQQPYDLWELIIIDDGSTDNTKELISTYTQRDTRIQYYYQENADQLNALLQGIEHVKGDYLMLLHSDDEMMPNILGELVTTLSQSTYDGLYARYYTFDAKGVFKEYTARHKYDSKNEAYKVLRNGAVNHIGDHFFIKRNALAKLKEDYLIDNTIYYLDYGKGSLNLLYSNTWYKYRVFEGNYANQPIGRFVAQSGIVRTGVKLVKAGYKIKYLTTNRYFRYFLRATNVASSKDFFDLNYLRSYMKYLTKIGYATYDVNCKKMIENVLYSIDAIVKKTNENEVKTLVIDGDFDLLEGKDARQVFKIIQSDPNHLYSKLFLNQYDKIVTLTSLEYKVRRVLNFYSLFTPIVLA
ncbi:MAG: glycosyltransferase [Sphingobacteriaceae bacterium]|nr:glycosyltransferase [Sphingobacteriaceae bacterium]